MPTTPMPRPGRLLLLTWTVGLASLVAWSARSTPPALFWAVLPYLALVAWHLIALPARREEASPSPRIEMEDPPSPVAGPDEVASPPAPVEPVVSNPDDPPSPPPARPPARARRKPRPRILPEPVPAAWVEVAPGRFVRGEAPEPPPPEPPTTTPIESAEGREPSAIVEESPNGAEIRTPADLTPDPGAGRFREGDEPLVTDHQNGAL